MGVFWLEFRMEGELESFSSSGGAKDHTCLLLVLESP